MKEHICILWCFNNYEHIAKCFESIYMDAVDYFIIENRSPYSPQIEAFFIQQRLVGYIQFEKNIGDNAVKIFLRDFQMLLRRYSYITFTDGDILVDNIAFTFAEMGGILERPEVGVCTVDLKLDNFPHHLATPGEWLPQPVSVASNYIECQTGAHLMTLKNKNLDILFNAPKALDNAFRMACASKRLKWVKTKRSKAYHLTWDYYHKGNEYYEFRVQNPNIFNQSNMCNYKKII